MAEKFYRTLLQSSNIVRPSNTQNRDCVICLQETGKLSPETGLVEVQVKLPCQHVVGSRCIVVWLKTNNSCPLCRRVLFQEQEHEEEDEEDEEVVGIEVVEHELLTVCEHYCFQLRLDIMTTRIAQTIVKNAWRTYPFSDQITLDIDTNNVIAIGMAIYIASSFTGHIRSPREICAVRDPQSDPLLEGWDVDGDQIRDRYRFVYSQRERLVNDVIIRSLGGRDRVWPSIDPIEESDDHIENYRDSLAVRERCVREGARLQASPLMIDLAQHIAVNVVRAGFHAFRHPKDTKHLSFPEITAVSYYIASHLLGQPVSRALLHVVVGSGTTTTWRYPDIRSTCIIVRDKCHPIVEEDICGTRGIQVSWESLEADIGEKNPDGRHVQISSYYPLADEEAARRVAARTVIPRAKRLRELCDMYCGRLHKPGFLPRATTIGLARRLCERFSPVERFYGCLLNNIAGACVYIACFCTAPHSYSDFRIMGLSVESLYTVHLMMAQEIVLGRVEVLDIAESMGVSKRRIRNSLLDHDFDKDE